MLPFFEGVDRHADAKIDRPACSTPEGILFYSELFEKSERLSVSLSTQAKESEVVAILTGSREADFLCSLLGILKASMIYVPLDTLSSDNVLTNIIDHSSTKVIVTNNSHLKRVEFLNSSCHKISKIINLDELTDQIQHDTKSIGNPDAAIYYTSGTTGKPKGILHSLQSLLQPALVEQIPKISPGMRIAVTFAATFGASRAALLRTLYYGATLCWWDPVQLGGEGILNDLRDQKIGVLYTSISLLRSILSVRKSGNEYPDLKYIVLGGEKVYWRDIKLLQKLLGKHIRIVCRYGTTEAGLISIYEVDCPAKVAGLVPAGDLVPEVSIEIVDNSGSLTTGKTGEIVVESNGIASGYWQPHEKEAIAFSTINVDSGRQSYNTGDLGFLSANHTLAVSGRADAQVKIRGFRVDLGAIEAEIRDITDVVDCSVIAIERSSGNMTCVAFYTLEEDAEIRSSTIRDLLALKLPYYSLPDILQQIPAIPLTESGKPDNKQLLLLIEKKKALPQKTGTKQSSRCNT